MKKLVIAQQVRILTTISPARPLEIPLTVGLYLNRRLIVKFFLSFHYIFIQDLPAGFQKESLRKVVSIKRKSMTSKGLWGTPVELAFKNFINTVTLAQSPNRMSPVE